MIRSANIEVAVTGVRLGFITFDQVAEHLKGRVAARLVEEDYWEFEDIPEEYKEEAARILKIDYPPIEEEPEEQENVGDID